jgi:hypothetical protein
VAQSTTCSGILKVIGIERRWRGGMVPAEKVCSRIGSRIEESGSEEARGAVEFAIGLSVP